MKPPDVRVLVPLAQRVFLGATHCCAHIVLDDPNYEDHHARGCLETARERQHPACIELCEALVACSRTQRAKLSRLVWSTPRVEVG